MTAGMPRLIRNMLLRTPLMPWSKMNQVEMNEQLFSSIRSFGLNTTSGFKLDSLYTGALQKIVQSLAAHTSLTHHVRIGFDLDTLLWAAP